eukprot:s6129_g4.t1
MESAYRNDILDDALPRRRARVQQEGQSGPVREKEDQKINPYLAQNAFFEEDNLDEFVAEFKRTPPQHVNRDHWAGLLPRPGILRRHHVKWRTHAFSPWEKDIGSSRRVVGCYKGGDQDSEEDDWSMRPSKKAAGKWKGHTDFFLTKQAAKDLLERHQEPYTAEILTAQIYKMANDEVGESSIQPDDWEGWKNTDAEEWAKIQASGTVRVLSTEESNKVSAQLQKEGKEDRILSSRLVRRNKPSEQPGEPAQKKSRLVIRGFEDPDACSLDRYSNLNVILQMAATLKFRGSCGDLKQAFMQSGPLKREAGKIYMWQPSCGLPGLEEGQIIEILHGVYGLIDAPLHWRRTLKAFLTEELQYRQCRLDPCVLVLHVEGAINGVIVVEVDDLLCFGLKEHELRLQKLRERSTVAASRNWLVGLGGYREGRPDAAAGASILASKMAKLKVRDVVALNRVIHDVRSKPELTLVYHAIPMERLRFGVATEASFDNYDDDSSQSAVGVLAYDVALTEGQTAKCLEPWSGDLQMFMASIKKQADLVLQKADADRLLRESLSIVDAKSVYDNVIKDGAQAADKYTALEVAIARERKDGLGAQMRWVEHQSMVVDALTKVGANPQALYRLLDSGHYRIVAEQEQLDERAELRAAGNVKPR